MRHRETIRTVVVDDAAQGHTQDNVTLVVTRPALLVDAIRVSREIGFSLSDLVNQGLIRILNHYERTQQVPIIARG